jgi:hypothetical protein
LADTGVDHSLAHDLELASDANRDLERIEPTIVEIQNHPAPDAVDVMVPIGVGIVATRAAVALHDVREPELSKRQKRTIDRIQRNVREASSDRAV